MTGRYFPRAHYAVDAFRFDGQWRDGWPKWLADRDDVTAYGSDTAGTPARRIVIENTTIGPQSVGRGCWVVRHYGGRIGVFTDDAFRATYEPVEAAA